jgi:TPR repeat protein
LILITKRGKSSFYFWLILNFVVFQSVIFAQQDRFESGLASKDRGHYATALRAWIPMAESGNAEAQNNVGYMYEEGLGVPQNYLLAMNWYRQAADNELAQAQHNMGMLYHHGYGVAQNLGEAFRWFKMAAEQELAESEYMLGLAYEKGEGTTLNYAEARRLFLSSARKNYTPAQMMYAFMLQAGEGGDSQPFSAYVWGKIAESNGSESAIDITTISGIQLEDDQIIEAEKITAACLNASLSLCPE